MYCEASSGGSFSHKAVWDFHHTTRAFIVLDREETFSRNANGMRAINGSPTFTPTPLALGLNVETSYFVFMAARNIVERGTSRNGAAARRQSPSSQSMNS